MKQIRLLPVVIAATFALLLLKGLGIMTNGGYVLIGTSTAVAANAEGEGHNADPSATPTADVTAPTLALPTEPTMTDSGPTLEDDTPTLPLGPEEASGGGHGDAAAGDHGAPAVAEGHDAPADAEHATAGGQEMPGPEDEPTSHLAEADAAAEACPPLDAAAQGAAPVDPLDLLTPDDGCAEEPAATHAEADAEPTIVDGSGNIVPLTADSASSEAALIERLSERREELDTRDAELDMRLALVEAAEKRIDERTAALEALEARINAMVDEKRSIEEGQFVALVAMYETMKAKDAAAIFDELEMPVLLRVARAINPRKMAPIMARMNPVKAKELTAGLAIDQVEPTIDLAQENLGALPQIVGQ